MTDIPPDVARNPVPSTGPVRLKLRVAIGARWRDLGTALHLKDYALDAIDEEYKKSSDKAEAVLCKAYGCMGKLFTIEVLVKALEDMEMAGAVECLIPKK